MILLLAAIRKPVQDRGHCLNELDRSAGIHPAVDPAGHRMAACPVLHSAVDSALGIDVDLHTEIDGLPRGGRIIGVRSPPGSGYLHTIRPLSNRNVDASARLI